MAIEYRLMADWLNNGQYNHADSDITEYLMGRPTVLRGRNYASQVYGRSLAGKVQCELNDGDSVFTNISNTAANITKQRALPRLPVRWQFRDTDMAGNSDPDLARYADWQDRWTGVIVSSKWRDRTTGFTKLRLICDGNLRKCSTVISVPQGEGIFVGRTTRDAAAAVLHAVGLPTYKSPSLYLGQRGNIARFEFDQRANIAWQITAMSLVDAAVATPGGLLQGGAVTASGRRIFMQRVGGQRNLLELNADESVTTLASNIGAVQPSMAAQGETLYFIVGSRGNQTLQTYNLASSNPTLTTVGAITGLQSNSAGARGAAFHAGELWSYDRANGAFKVDIATRAATYLSNGVAANVRSMFSWFGLRLYCWVSNTAGDPDVIELREINTEDGSLSEVLLTESRQGVQNISSVVSGGEQTLFGDTIMSYWWGDSTPAIDLLHDIEATEGGFIYEREDGLIAMEDRTRRQRLFARTVVSDFTNVETPMHIDAANPTPDGLDNDNPTKDVANIIHVEIRQFQRQAQPEVLWTLTTPINLPSGSATMPGTLTIDANYPTPGAPSDNVACAEWIAPAVTADYDAQTGLAVTSVVNGNTLRITLTNTGGANLIINRLQARGYALKELAPFTYTARDEASIAAHDPNTYIIDAPWLNELELGRQDAAFTLQILAQLREYVHVTIPVDGNEELVLKTGLSSRVRLQRVGREPEFEEFFVESIKDTIVEAGEVGSGVMHVTYTLSPAVFFGRVIILDVGPPLGEGVLGV